MSTRSRANLRFLFEYKVVRDIGPGQNGLKPSEKKSNFHQLAVRHGKWQNGRMTNQLTPQELAHCQDGGNLYEAPTSVMITAHKNAVVVMSDVTTHGVPADTIWSSIGFDDTRPQIRIQYGATQSYQLSAGQNSTWARLIPDNHIDAADIGNQNSRPLAGAVAVIIALAVLSNPASPGAVLASGFQTRQANGARYWASVATERTANIGVVVRIYTYNTPPASAGSSKEELKTLCKGNSTLGPVFDC